jgi:hypothetical protein
MMARDPLSTEKNKTDNDEAGEVMFRHTSLINGRYKKILNHGWTLMRKKEPQSAQRTQNKWKRKCKRKRKKEI